MAEAAFAAGYVDLLMLLLSIARYIALLGGAIVLDIFGGFVELAGGY